MTTLMARSLDGAEMFFGLNEVTHVVSADDVFYIGDTPCALDSVDCLEAAQLRELAETQSRIITTKNDTIASLTQRVADLEAALRDIIAESPNPKLPYGHRVNEIARGALTNTTLALATDYADDLVNDCETGGAEVQS